MPLYIQNRMRGSFHRARIRNLEAQNIKQFIRDAVHPRELETFTIGIAGSATLSWYLEKLHQDLEALPTTPLPFAWNDIDIFVCGPHAETRVAFVAFVDSMKHRLTRKGYAVERIIEAHFYPVALGRLCMEVMELAISGIATPITIIRCVGLLNVMEAVDHFDLDVCKIIYNFRHGYYLLSSTIKQNVLHGQMDVDVRLMEYIDARYVSASKILMLEKSVGRIEKYRARGFTITNFPHAVSKLNDCAERSRIMIHYHMASDDQSEEDQGTTTEEEEE